MREHGTHPRLLSQGKPKACGRIETGQVFEQKICIDEGQTPWRRIELRLDTPTESGETTIWLWSNLPAEVSASKDR